LDPKIYVQAEQKKKPKPAETAKKLTELVAKEYSDIRISVSLLNNFFECPWKWYFRSFLKLPEPENESLKFGNRVHSALDRILKMKKKPTEKEILEMVEGEKDAQKIVLDWCKKRLPEISRQHESEKNISLKDKEFPHLNIYGKIDLLEELEPKILRVTDFKTGRPRRKSEIEKMDEDSAFAESFGEARERMSDYLRQLAIYSYLLRESRKGRVNVKESRLEFLEAGKEEEKFYQTFIDEEKIDLLKKDIKDYDRLLKSGQWPNRPCHFKSYGRANIECEYCQLAKIYKNTEV
jgi:CRISPR/Cas system-associated exonuclease Cas4 (RecB family)